jgi:UTP--glucose-1-phosphate uridylyltransferase
MSGRVRKAVIPAAGMGTRFLPATKAQPKEMLPIVDKPTIQYIVEEAVHSGIEDILIITGRGKRAIEDHFDKSIELETILSKKKSNGLLKVIQDITDLVDIYYVRQKEPLGLGHAIWCARKFIGDEPFAVLLGDDVIDAQTPCLQQLIDAYEANGGASVLGVQPVPWEDVPKYGVVDLGEPVAKGIRVKNVVEKPSKKDSPSNLAILGRYILDSEIMSILEDTKPGAGGEIQLTDAIRELANRKTVVAYEFTGKRYDVGDKLGFLQATVEFALKREDLKDSFAGYLGEVVSRLI